MRLRAGVRHDGATARARSAAASSLAIIDIIFAPGGRRRRARVGLGGQSVRAGSSARHACRRAFDPLRPKPPARARRAATLLAARAADDGRADRRRPARWPECPHAGHRGWPSSAAGAWFRAGLRASRPCRRVGAWRDATLAIDEQPAHQLAVMVGEQERGRAAPRRARQPRAGSRCPAAARCPVRPPARGISTTSSRLSPTWSSARWCPGAARCGCAVVSTWTVPGRGSPHRCRVRHRGA